MSPPVAFEADTSLVRSYESGALELFVLPDLPVQYVFRLQQPLVFDLDQFGIDVMLLFKFLLCDLRRFQVIRRRVLNVQDPIERLLNIRDVAILGGSRTSGGQCPIVSLWSVSP